MMFVAAEIGPSGPELTDTGAPLLVVGRIIHWASLTLLLRGKY